MPSRNLQAGIRRLLGDDGRLQRSHLYSPATQLSLRNLPNPDEPRRLPADDMLPVNDACDTEIAKA
jgi:hypothetical protein